jgi:ATP-dependent exoDNAse (exonuclease V) alpha subunit
MAHLESFRANTFYAASVYVAISRARTSAAVYTDCRASLTEVLGLRDRAQVGAVDEITNFKTKLGAESPLPQFH